MSALAESNSRQAGSDRRVTFDEDGIAVDMAERGVLYGTQKINQPETPYIYYNPEEDPDVAAQFTRSGSPVKVHVSTVSFRPNRQKWKFENFQNRSHSQGSSIGSS